MNAEDIAARILAHYPDAQIETEGADCNFSVTVTSEAFKGLSLIQRQQPLLALFREELGSSKLHALSIVTQLPDDTASVT